jgi:hypothetical protein
MKVSVKTYVPESIFSIGLDNLEFMPFITEIIETGIMLKIKKRKFVFIQKNRNKTILHCPLQGYPSNKVRKCKFCFLQKPPRDKKP